MYRLPQSPHILCYYKTKFNTISFKQISSYGRVRRNKGMFLRTLQYDFVNIYFAVQHSRLHLDSSQLNSLYFFLLQNWGQEINSSFMRLNKWRLLAVGFSLVTFFYTLLLLPYSFIYLTYSTFWLFSAFSGSKHANFLCSAWLYLFHWAV